MVSVAIFDYGAGNIFSLKNSLEKAGASVDVITNFDEPNKYSGLLLPGVGNFDPAINSIRNYSKTEFRDYVGDMPVLGICLGMEMFFEKSEEGKESGLNVIDGEVIVLPPTLKVPHMGWNDLEIKKPGKILEGVDDGSWVYFVHSYRVKPSSDDVITAVSDYGIKVPAVVEKDNFIGTQFHPEKSSTVGKMMIKNFLDVCKK
ncbi:imidazole glycerol phosphate synthase subunit HisH [Nitrosopumilus zosterae]|uniref:Imidazole glycerol phosphate synthase subunit HisH n=1 Tax=Nitrosopumilus zosterae TaxID=718286 RepID=A0A2S2KT75_9ARCH|nr:imidazole glycerol phosphate synthase subunit HisH [Nitrosopumilus zosterae]BDQ30140.1 imidazole glycerol phosphate synthase subunit HisH [Nitrosopumilus zosterae]GBH34757.1 imidazole glycerol phosphate synthase subunit HisH [Nitrosopumilus zosterae]